MIHMSYYAFLDENNIVNEVIPGKNVGEDGIDWEQWYGDFKEKPCKRTCVDTIAGQNISGGIPFRKNFASIGFKYDAERDAFIPPKQFESWILNEEKCLWEAPIPYPDDGNSYMWNEENKSWEITESSLM